MSIDIRWEEEHVDWGPLKALVGEDSLFPWMWMHTCDSPETGEAVHFYKHINSRRHLRLDASGRVYSETEEGEPVLLPACGGATVLLQLLAACGHVEPGLPPTIALSDAAREPAATEDVPVLSTLVQLLGEQYRSLLRAVARSTATTASRGRG